MRSPCFALAVFFVILSLFLLSLLLKYLVNKRTSQLLKLIDEKKELLRREKENFKRIETLQKVGIVGLMSSMFAHEVRQPLSTISCWGHVLKKLAGQSENSKEMVPLIEKMVSAASQAEKKITDIRGVLRTQEPKLEKN
jgi:putative histidine kinase A domain protein